MLMLSLACGGGSTPNSSKPKEVVFGMMAAESGPSASTDFGAAEELAAKMAVDEINKAGGIEGAKVRGVYTDHAGDAATGAKAMNQLLNVNAVQVVFSSFTAVTTAIAPTANSGKVLVLDPSSRSSALLKLGDYVYVARSVDSDEDRMMATYLVKTAGYKRVGMLYADIAALQNSRQIIEQTVKSLGGQFVAGVSVPTTTTDYSSAIALLKGATPDVIYVSHTGGKDLANMARQIRSQGLTTPLASYSSAIDPSLVAVAGPGVLDGMLASSQVYYEPGQVKAQADFNQKFQQLYGRAGSTFSASVYDAVKGIYVTAVKYLFDHNLSYTGANLKKAIDAIKVFPGPVTGTCRFASDHHCLKDMGVYKFSNGSWGPVAKVAAPAPTTP